MNINYPFNRILKDSVFNSSEDKLTISGQLIAPEIIRDITSGEYEYSDLKMCSLNPQLSEASYLMRYELETLSDQSFYYLSKDKKRSISEILRAAQVIREEIWDSWDICTETATSEDTSPSDYYTGSQSEKVGPKSFRTWAIYSDPSSALEYVPDDWFEQKKWMVDTPWIWPEIYMVIALLMIDEATVFLNLHNPYKASTWLLRASEFVHLSWWTKDDSFAEAKTALAKMGGAARLTNNPKQAAKQTGKSFVFQCWQVWQEEPEKYKDKTDFAKTMLKQVQCEALESPKVITDWCRLWEKAHPAG